jgi:ABC-type Fe3+-hydroxamate transport system substrate-binding protein
MRVISLVPSWTETLLLSGVNVVGRTRFCIHPKEHVAPVQVVGGTKDLDWEKVKALNADLLVLDQEENLPWMKEQSPIPVLVTHVTGIADMESNLKMLAKALPEQAEKLTALAARWKQIAAARPCAWNFKHIPGELEKLAGTDPTREFQKLVYVIWKKPWMSVSKETFIGSMLRQFGAGKILPDFEKKYPAFEMTDFDPETTYFLFSSEPFPFVKKKSELESLRRHGSLVDGECYSWFGIRSLEFAEKIIASSST